MNTYATDSPDYRRYGVLLVVIGAIGAAAGFMVDPDRTWVSWLHAALFPLTIVMGATAFVAINHVGNAGWFVSLRRVPEAMMNWIPAGGVILLIGGVGGSFLFGGGHGHQDHDIGIRTAWLDTTFLLVRMVAIILLWTWLAWRVRSASYAQDRDGDHRWTRIARNRSALFLVVFAITFTAASFDWIMSLDHGFYSTIFAFYTFTGSFVSGMAAVTLFAVLLSRRGLVPRPNSEQLHSLGKLLFAFATFWAYLWFCQYMLIYYANIPEEIAYYITRTNDGWEWLFWGNLIVGWLAPFILLLSRNVKRSETYVLRVASLILIAHWWDLYVMVVPGTGASPVPSWTDVALSLCFLPIAIGVTVRAFNARPPVPVRDPYLCEVDVALQTMSIPEPTDRGRY